MTFLLELGSCPPSTLDQLCPSDKDMENPSLESLAEPPLLWQPQCVQALHSHCQPGATCCSKGAERAAVPVCFSCCPPKDQGLQTSLPAPAQPLQGCQGAEPPLGLLLPSWNKSRLAGSPAGSHAVESRETSSSSAEGIKNIINSLKQVLLPVLTDLCVWQGQKFRV